MIGMLILAQTLPHSGDVDWKYWLNLAVTVFAIIVLPTILFILTLIMNRLREGEKTFQELSTATTKLATQRDASQESLNEIKTDLKKLTDDTHQAQLTDAGLIGKFRAEIAREFVRKEELKELREHTDQQHQAVMRAIEQIQKR